MTREQRRKIYEQAARKVGSEVTLLLTAGFSLIMVVLFFFGDRTFLPVAARFEISPTLVWIGMSVLISAGLAFGHARLASRAITQARRQQFAIHQWDEARKRADTEKKIGALKGSAP